MKGMIKGKFCVRVALHMRVSGRKYAWMLLFYRRRIPSLLSKRHEGEQVRHTDVLVRAV